MEIKTTVCVIESRHPYGVLPMGKIESNTYPEVNAQYAEHSFKSTTDDGLALFGFIDQEPIVPTSEIIQADGKTTKLDQNSLTPPAPAYDVMLKAIEDFSVQFSPMFANNIDVDPLCVAHTKAKVQDALTEILMQNKDFVTSFMITLWNDQTDPRKINASGIVLKKSLLGDKVNLMTSAISMMSLVQNVSGYSENIYDVTGSFAQYIRPRVLTAIIPRNQFWSKELRGDGPSAYRGIIQQYIKDGLLVSDFAADDSISTYTDSPASYYNFNMRQERNAILQEMLLKGYAPTALVIRR